MVAFASAESVMLFIVVGVNNAWKCRYREISRAAEIRSADRLEGS